ncbi:MAG: O-antigen ligase family protein [Lachnospiraceae bacterium]|nr:O-antigen ligase family protein [Lachnospiraceae bacterium]
MRRICSKLWHRAAEGYVYVMLLVFPLYMHDGYFDITVSKFRFAVFGTLLFGAVIVVSYLWNARKLPWRFGAGRLKYFLLFLVAAGISALFSPYDTEAFWGNMGRYCGLFLYLIYGLMLWLVLEFPGCKIRFLYVAELSAVLVGFLGILNHYSLDPLGIFTHIIPHEQNIFVSTIGHMGLFAEYAGMMLAVAGTLFLVDDAGNKSWFHSGVFLILALAVPSSGTEGAYIGALVFFAASFFGVRDQMQQVKWCMLLLLFLLAHVLIGVENILLAKAKPLGMIGNWLCRSNICVPLCAGTVVLLLVLWNFPRIVNRKRIHRMQAVLKWLLIISVGCAVGVFLVYETIRASAGETQFFLADEWGNYRGYIWRKTWEYFCEMPLKHKLFGMGPDTVYQVYRNICTEPFLTDYGLYYDNAHNEYLQMLLTHGLLGIASWLLWVGKSTFLILKKKKRNIGCAAVGAALLTYEAMALVGIQAVNTQVMFVLLIGLGLRYAAGSRSEGELAVHIERVMNMSRSHEEWRREYMTQQMRDLENQEIGKEIGIELGKEIGVGLGEKARAVETAQTMLEQQEPLEKIVLYTGLSREEIEEVAGKRTSM